MTSRLLACTVITMLVAAGMWACADTDQEGDALTDSASDTTADTVTDTGTDTDAATDTGVDPDTALDPDTVTDTAHDTATDWTVDYDSPESLDGLPCPDPAAGFDESDPGINMFVTISSIMMMGTNMALAVGGFMPTAREDFDPDPPSTIPLDTCVVGEEPAPTPECATAADCAPEQQCLPETDDSGNPIAGTEHCVTPREMLDVGTFEIVGFASGPMTFAYNSGQQGAYTATTSADGQIDPASLAYDTTYYVHKDANPTAGLGELEGLLYVPPFFEMTSPETTINAMGLPEISVTVTEDLTLEWNGATGDGTLLISLAGTGGSITCLADDDGSFTIPADMVAAAGLGAVAFFNMLTLTHEVNGLVCGEGLTWNDTMYSHMVLYSVRKL